VNDEERSEQEALHEALAATLELPDDALLTGWCLTYEYRQGDDSAAGVMRGPATLTA
jgi:hypothetical protein